MPHQIIPTDGADELVILPRSEYDALRAAAGDEVAEMRAAERIVRASDAAISRGDEAVLPDWLAAAVMEGDTVVKAARRHAGRTQIQLASEMSITQGYLSEIESGKKAPNASMRTRLAAALGIEAAWIEGEDHASPRAR